LPALEFFSDGMSHPRAYVELETISYGIETICIDKNWDMEKG